jgi:hypothetical protein
MKKSFSIFVLTVAILATGFYQKTIAQSSSEVLMRAIAFHDSLNIWNDYSGKVNLMTAFSGNRSSGGETIEIKTKDGFYRNTRPAEKTVRGVKNGECFMEVDGNERILNENQVETILQYKDWHYFHFGILMELKASGLILSEKVGKVKFQCNDCLALQFTYDANKVKNDSFKNNNWTVYLDPADYSMKGYKEEGVMNLYAVFSGILIVNGLKLPLCRTYFKNDDNSFFMVDLFTKAD